MPIYELGQNSIEKIDRTTFAESKIKERQHLQNLLRNNIEVISDDLMVIAEEFGDWENSKRRIDLLCLDKNANIVVVELKRTEDGGHMDLQALRYSAMASTMTLGEVTNAHQAYLDKNKSEDEDEGALGALERIKDFLESEVDSVNGIDENNFAQDVRIILVSAEFSTELTATALWLNDKELDIRLVKMEPYKDGERILLDVQQVVPLPEAKDYHFRSKQKKQQEQKAKMLSKDYSKYTLTINGKNYANLNKRHFIFKIISVILGSGEVKPDEIESLIHWRKIFACFDGDVTGTEIEKRLNESSPNSKLPRSQRFFCKDAELFKFDGKTYALSNNWGIKTDQTATKIKEKWEKFNISWEKHG